MYRDTDTVDGTSSFTQSHNAGSSLVVSNNKVTAIGQSSFNNTNMEMSFKSANINDEKSAREKARRSGYVVSKKFRLKILPPPSVTRMIFKGQKYQSTSL